MRTWTLLAVVFLVACGDDGSAGDAGTSVDAAVDAAFDAGVDAGLPPNEPPVAAFEWTRDGATVGLDASASTDPDGRIVAWSWELGDGATGEGETLEHVYAADGCPTVRLTVTDDRGATASAEQTLSVATAAPPEAVEATLDPLPGAGALLPRDVSTSAATLTVSGTVGSPGWLEARVRWLRDGAVESETTAPVCDGAFAVETTLPAELVARDLEVHLVAAEREAALGATTDLVAGDVLVVQGQSNAEARAFAGDANVDRGEFVRSFGSRTENGAVSAGDGAWHRADGNLVDGPGAVGQWGLRLAKLLSDRHGVPVAVLNGARGGQPIEYFQRNDADPADLATNYGRLLDRARRAGVAESIRAILFYQGESDGARADAHRDGFTALHEDWREDFPGVERFYVTQVRQGCGAPTVELRDVQRRFAETLPDTTTMSTTGIDAHDGCHYAFVGGYSVLADRYARLLSRDLYDGTPEPDTEAVDVASAMAPGDGTVRVTTRGDASTLLVADGVAPHFVADGVPGRVTAVAAEGADLVLTMTGPSPSRIGYAGHVGAGPWITNAEGVGLLAFELAVAGP